MEIYWGNVGANEVIEYMRKHNFRILYTSPDFRTPKINNYALDNGAYSDWKHNKDFKGEEFLNFLSKYKNRDITKPDWVAVPDRVAEGNRSLDFSLKWKEKIPDYFDRLLLVVQDGMSFENVEKHIDEFFGLFVGGTKRWKIDTSEDWIKLAHEYDKICHIGRISKYSEVMWAKRIGADSIDSTTWAQNFKYNSYKCLNDLDAQKRLI